MELHIRKSIKIGVSLLTVLLVLGVIFFAVRETSVAAAATQYRTNDICDP